MTLRLFIDEDAGTALASLLERGADFDVLTTVAAGRANSHMSDESQLEFAAAQNRTLFSFNRNDYESIAKRWADEDRHHAGIVTARQAKPHELVPGFRELISLYPDGLPPDLCMHLPRISRQL